MEEKVTVFISHASEDEPLARAWMDIIRSLPGKTEVPFLAEDSRRGIHSGDKWAEKIDKALIEAHTTIAILTPSSNDRPWVLWESGVAYGMDKKFIPVFCYLKKESVNPVFSRFQAHDVSKRESAADLCKELFYPNENLSETDKALLDVLLQQYEDVVATHKLAAQTHGLFNHHFHNHDRAKLLDGYWLADWDFYDETGELRPYERDELCFWTTDDRIRAVGYNTKTGIDQLGDIAKFYPMEGMVSSSGWITFSYWSAATIQYCGVVLLHDDGTGLGLDGTWEGYSTQQFGAPASLKKGTVSLRKILRTDETPVLEALTKNDGSGTSEQIAAETGFTEEKTARILNHLVIVGKTIKTSDGGWEMMRDE